MSCLEPAHNYSGPLHDRRYFALQNMIQFKFSKTAGYDTIQFAGIGMKLSELKAAIIAKKNLAPDASQAHAQTVDLYIHNAETGVGV